MDAREIISLADHIAREQGLTQAEWCREAGYDEFGKLISNAFKRGNCKLSVMTQLLKPLGYELVIARKTYYRPGGGKENGTGREKAAGKADRKRREDDHKA